MTDFINKVRQGGGRRNLGGGRIKI